VANTGEALNVRLFLVRAQLSQAAEQPRGVPKGPLRVAQDVSPGK
jgi:hypothetical protein